MPELRDRYGVCEADARVHLFTWYENGKGGQVRLAFLAVDPPASFAVSGEPVVDGRLAGVRDVDDEPRDGLVLIGGSVGLGPDEYSTPGPCGGR